MISRVPSDVPSDVPPTAAPESDPDANGSPRHDGLSVVPFGAGSDLRMLVSAPIVHTVLGLSVTDDAALDTSLDALVTRGELHEEEAALARTIQESRRAAFVAGRRALRAAIRSVAPDRADTPLLLARPLLRTTRGAPTLPAGVRGSISHKRTRAIALAESGDVGHLGVDLEERTPLTKVLAGELSPHAAHLDFQRFSLASRILTVREQVALQAEIETTIIEPDDIDLGATESDVAQVVRERSVAATAARRDAVRDAIARDATLLRFALKEAVYKAIDPVVQRYVRFTEVEVDVHEGGLAAVRLLLPELDANSAKIQAWWQMDDKWIIAAVRAEL